MHHQRRLIPVCTYNGVHPPCVLSQDRKLSHAESLTHRYPRRPQAPSHSLTGTQKGTFLGDSHGSTLGCIAHRLCTLSGPQGTARACDSCKDKGEFVLLLWRSGGSPFTYRG